LSIPRRSDLRIVIVVIVVELFLLRVCEPRTPFRAVMTHETFTILFTIIIVVCLALALFTTLVISAANHTPRTSTARVYSPKFKRSTCFLALPLRLGCSASGEDIAVLLVPLLDRGEVVVKDLRGEESTSEGMKRMKRMKSCHLTDVKRVKPHSPVNLTRLYRFPAYFRQVASVAHLQVDHCERLTSTERTEMYI
jgi:hypothetical protein